MNTKQLNETSKFLSYVLRHEPHAIGLQLDSEGWANIESLVAGAAKDGRILDIALIQAVVSSSDKKRFSLSEDGLRIRAVQGFKFFQAENGVWLTTHVQAGFINQHSDDL